MRPARAIPEEAKAKLFDLLKSVKSKGQLLRVLCVWLRAEFGFNAAQIARAIGWQPGSVSQLHFRYFREGESALIGTGRGGRRHAYLTPDEEQRFLRPFIERAEKGGILVASEIHPAYEAKIGRKVPPSTIYRMLARNGWRKIAPRPRHPKTDVAKQEDFKKNSRSSLRRSKGLPARENDGD